MSDIKVTCLATIHLADCRPPQLVEIAVEAVNLLKRYGYNGSLATVRERCGWAPVKAPEPPKQPIEPLNRLEVYALRAGDRITAIKAYRDRFLINGMRPGLKEAIDAIDACDISVTPAS